MKQSNVLFSLGAVIAVASAMVLVEYSTRSSFKSVANGVPNEGVSLSLTESDLGVSSLNGAASEPVINLIASSPQDKNAVVQLANGELTLISVGDIVMEQRIEIVQIAVDRVIVRDTGTSDLLIVHLQKGNKPSLISRLSTNVEIDAALPLSVYT